MGRSPCCEKVGLKKGPWTPEEDQKLLAYIEEHGHGSWRALPAKAGLQRCGKSCRLRWTNYLRPDIKRGKFSLQEEQTIIQLHALLGNRWSAIATHLAKRTDNEIKNYWNTHLKKRLTKMGIDPVTHKPKTDALGSNSGNPKDAANLSHMAQWESARLEAEARLVRESKLIVAAAGQTQQVNQAQTQSQTQSHHFKHGTGHLTVPPCLDILKAWQGSWSTRSNPNNNNNNVSSNNSNSNNALLCMFAMDDLESPTSTLNFPVATIEFSGVPSVALFENDGDDDNNEKNMSSFYDNMATNSSNWFMEGLIKKNHNNNVIDSVTTTTTTMTATENMSNIVMENFGDVFVYGSNGSEVEDPSNNNDGDGSSCGGASGFFDIQMENKSYWNSILNLVNVSPTGSPVF